MNLGGFDIHDIKSKFNKVKATVMNFTEMEQKVKEATNGDPWGASSSLMGEIAQKFNEIMATVYKRFHETGKSWRNIYKALTLLEYLLKNGSERVVDAARSNMYELRALDNFNYIDEAGKDQGVNIRHRAKLIMELMVDSDLLRDERAKAKANKQKYGGIGSDTGGSKYVGFGSNAGGGGSGNRYGSDSYGSASSGGGYPGNSSNRGYHDNESPTCDSGNSSYQSPQVKVKDDDFGDFQNGSKFSGGGNNNNVPAAPVAQKENNLLAFDESPAPAKASTTSNDWGAFSSAAPTNTQKGVMPDEFADFQSAAIAPSPSSKPTTSPSAANFFGAAQPFAVPPQQQQNNAFANFSAFSSASAAQQYPQQQQQQQQPQYQQQQQYQQNNAFGNFSAFSSTPAAQPTGGNNAMGGLFGASTQQPQSSQPAGNAFANFGVFQSPAGSSGANQQLGIANTTSLAPKTPTQPQSATAGKNPLWNSNLVDLDSLGKFGPPKGQTGPSMNALAQTQQQLQSPQVRAPSQTNFDGFNTSSMGSMPGQSNMFNRNGPALNTMSGMGGMANMGGMNSAGQSNMGGFTAFGQLQQQQQQQQQQGGFPAFGQNIQNKPMGSSGGANDLLL